MMTTPRLLLLAALFTGCVDSQEFVYGDSLGPLEFELFSPDMGVHPDVSVMNDPNNPFSQGIGAGTKFDVAVDGPVAAFYGWSTALVGEPTGEHQFYAAANAHAIYDGGLAAPEDLVFVRDIAIRGYNNVLNVFPGAVTFSADGRQIFDLAPQAYLGIEALGGDVEGGWIYIPTEDGGAVAQGG